MGFRLPCVSQIRRWMQLFEFKVGFNTDVLELLKSYCDSLMIEDRNCIITWDEMSIKQLIEYDKNADIGRHSRNGPFIKAVASY